jgi:rhomboid-like protein
LISFDVFFRVCDDVRDDGIYFFASHMHVYISLHVAIVASFLSFSAINVAVWGCWRVPHLHGLMERHFTTSVSRFSRSTGGGVLSSAHTLLFSTFSHQSAMHLAFNSMALLSIAPPVCRMLGDELFLAFYCTTGVLSSALGNASVLMLAALSRGRSLSAMSMLHIPSLGASGAVFGVFAVTALLRPDAEFILIFLPSELCTLWRRVFV